MKWLATTAACFALVACDVFPSRLRDLSLERVTFVPAGSPLHLQTQDPPDRPTAYFRITVASSQNLAAKSEASELNIYPMVVECAQRERELFTFGPYLDGMDVSIYRLDSDHPQRPLLATAERSRFSYDLFLPVVGRSYVDDDQGGSYFPYDLITNPTTLCIRIGGGNMLGGHFRSNELRLRINPQKDAP